MPTTTDDPVQLRERARALRSLAHTLDHLPALGLVPYAGTDTWAGAQCDAARGDLVDATRHVQAAADGLRQQASWLDSRARSLEPPPGVS
jgi:hypothetical protein